MFLRIKNTVQLHVCGTKSYYDSSKPQFFPIKQNSKQTQRWVEINKPDSIWKFRNNKTGILYRRDINATENAFFPYIDHISYYQWDLHWTYMYIV